MKRTLLFILCLFIAGCKEQSPTSNNDSNKFVLMPLSKGNKWISKQELMDSLGTVKDTFYDTLVIERDTLIGVDTWFVSQNNSYLRNGANGLYAYDELYHSQELLFKYPSNVGDSIPINYSNNQYCTLISKSDSVEFNGTKYAVYVYRRYKGVEPGDYRIWIDYFTFIPNIGMVSVEQIVVYTYNNTKGMWIKRNLVSFTTK